MMNPDEISYSQLDITENIGDNERLEPEEWISTMALNAMTPASEANGLPPVGANEEQVYSVAEALSQIRESFAISTDGVYCPVCHIANTQLAKLGFACPKCGRPLLRFGWD
jgi:hypothetical protein